MHAQVIDFSQQNPAFYNSVGEDVGGYFYSGADKTIDFGSLTGRGRRAGPQRRALAPKGVVRNLVVLVRFGMHVGASCFSSICLMSAQEESVERNYQ